MSRYPKLTTGDGLKLIAALKALVEVYDKVGGPLAVDPAVAQARALLREIEGA